MTTKPCINNTFHVPLMTRSAPSHNAIFREIFHQCICKGKFAVVGIHEISMQELYKIQIKMEVQMTLREEFAESN